MVAPEAEAISHAAATPAYFYPDAREFAGASRIRLSAGSDAQADFSLALEPFYPVTFIPVPPGAASLDDSVMPGNTAVILDATGHPLDYVPQFDSATHSLQVSLPDGAYTLLIHTFAGQEFLGRASRRSGTLVGAVQFAVAGHPVSGLRVPLAPPSPGTVHLRVIHTSQAVESSAETTRTSTCPSMWPTEFPRPAGENIWSMENHGDSIEFTAQPGAYWLSVNLARKGVCVGALGAGGVNLAREPLAISLASAPPTLDLTLRDDCGTLALNLPPALATFLPGDEPFYTVYIVPEFDTVQDIPPLTIHPSSGQTLTVDGLTRGLIASTPSIPPSTLSTATPQPWPRSPIPARKSPSRPVPPPASSWRSPNTDAPDTDPPDTDEDLSPTGPSPGAPPRRRVALRPAILCVPWCAIPGPPRPLRGAPLQHRRHHHQLRHRRAHPPRHRRRPLEEDSQTIAAVESDGNGHFTIEHLPPAKYQLTASKRGYRTAFYDEHDEFNSAIVTGPGQDTSNLSFRLVPGGVIRGVVSTDGGDPVEGAHVLLPSKVAPRQARPPHHSLRRRNHRRHRRLEFDGLAAGEYLIAVVAEPPGTPCTAPQPLQARPPPTPRTRPASDPAAALDVAYPVTYFDSTTDEASARLVVAGGSRQEADIILHAVPALRIQVDTPKKQDGSIARAELRQTVFGTVNAVSAGFLDAMQTGATEFDGVAPGHYELAQGDPPRVVEMDATASGRSIPPGEPTTAVSVRGILRGPGRRSALPDDVQSHP